jgi:hypothetical protein
VCSLAELQRSFARAMTAGGDATFDAEVGGGIHPRHRIAIHRRHYETSLTAALCDKFPASAWLVGTDRVRAAARAYARAHSPQQPCIAEYGGDFPQFLATHAGAASVPYLASFATLEWAVGQVSIAIERAPRSWSELSRLGPEQLVDATLALQPGLRYLRSAWRIDELMTTYLRGAEPERFVLAEVDTAIEARGARGAIRLDRLDLPSFAFRAALAEGRSIGDAASAALDLDPAFDAGEGLRALAAAGLVAGVSAQPEDPA